MSYSPAKPDASIAALPLRACIPYWSMAAVLVAAGAVMLPFDVALARQVSGSDPPTWIEKLQGFAELFGHGMGVLVIVVVISVLDPSIRLCIPRIVAASLGSGLVANVAKLLVARVRPAHFNFELSGMDTFTGWLPLMQNGSSQQSFPSSHAATAAGLAIVLAYYYPRGRVLFPVLAACACLQRIAVEAHFASDVLWGAAVGCLIAPLFINGGIVSRTFDSLEMSLRLRSLAPFRQPPQHH